MDYGFLSRLAVLDTETTGIDEGSRVVELAVVLVNDGQLGRGMSWLLNPGVPIPPTATEVHGISDKDVEKAPTFAEIAVDLGLLLEGRRIAAYNAPFDQRMLAGEWRAAELVAVPWLDEGWIDPLVWAREAQKYDKGKKLEQVARRLGIPPQEKAHRALADATTAAEVLLALRQPAAWSAWSRDRRRNGLHDDPRRFFPADYEPCIRAQDALRAEQEADFARWRARQGRRTG
jgi:DNA polymerase-3 subunit epsilon